MKTITLTESAIRIANIISDQNSLLEIRHQPPHAYILIDKSRSRCIHSFESVNLSRLLAEQQCSISSAIFSERSIIMGNDAEPFYELYIEFVNGKSFALSTSGRLNEVTAYRSNLSGAALAYAPQSIWSIPQNLIPLKMILTGRLIDMINELSCEGGQLAIINRLNYEYSNNYNGASSMSLQIQIERHNLNCLVINFEPLRLFDLEV